jgi:RNA polymerase-interacting CarD/CdnL/TRCF family regulator
MESTMKKTDKKLPVGSWVYYPPHGVGVVTHKGLVSCAEIEINSYTIFHSRLRLKVHIPVPKAQAAGLQSVQCFATTEGIDLALNKLTEPRKISRAMWSRRQRELEQLLTSADLVSLARVIKNTNPEEESSISYSERTLLNQAAIRLLDVLSIALEKSHEATMQYVNAHLQKHGKTELQFSTY